MSTVNTKKKTAKTSKKPAKSRKAKAVNKAKNAGRKRVRDASGKPDDMVPFHCKMPRSMRGAMDKAARAAPAFAGNASLWARVTLEKALGSLKLIKPAK